MQIEYVGWFQVVVGILGRFWPVWVALILVLGASYAFRRRLGLYGQLFDSGVGIAGVGICFFWLFTAIFAHKIAPFDPLAQVPIMKDTLPGAIDPASHGVYLLGGDKLRSC
jgi:peptide/nickel transport system permease protein